MDATSLCHAVSGQRPPVITTAVDCPRYTRTESASICMFLRKYNQCSHEVAASAQNITEDYAPLYDIVRPVQLRLCVSFKWLKLFIDFGFNLGVQGYSIFWNEKLSHYLPFETVALKNVLTIGTPVKLAQSRISIDVTNENGWLRLNNHLVSFKSLLRQHGLTWFTRKSEQTAVCHVLSAIPTGPPRHGPENDLEMFHDIPRMNFKDVVAQAIDLPISRQKPSDTNEQISYKHWNRNYNNNNNIGTINNEKDYDL